MEKLPQVCVFHDNCKINCKHCFCKPSAPADLDRTEKLMSRLKERGHRVHLYVTDPKNTDAFDKLVRPDEYGTLQCKDKVDPRKIGEEQLASMGISLSLHGHNAALHDAICQKGNFDRTIRALEEAKRLDLKNVRVNCVIFRQNYRYVEEIAELVSRYGVAKLYFLKLAWAGQAREMPDEMFLDKKAYTEFYRIFMRARKKVRRKITIALEPEAWGPLCSSLRIRLLLILRPFFGKRRRFCECGSAKVTVDAGTGKVYPCYGVVGFDDVCLGRFDDEKGLELDNPVWLGDLFEKIGEPCRSCGLLDYCGGHCRIRAIENLIRAGAEIDPYVGHDWCPIAMGIRVPFNATEMLRTAKDVLQVISPRLLRLLILLLKFRRAAHSHRILQSF